VKLQSCVIPGSGYLAPAAMIFAVSMTMIDQTIVAIAAPQIQNDLGLSSTGLQWVINAYLLSLAALFAFGGRLSDTLGHRTTVLAGIGLFAVASALCGLAPGSSGLTEAWMVTFRVLQGAGGALMYPAALAIVVSGCGPRERGRTLAVFFAIAGAFTALGPVIGGLLVQWTWRAIFWINLPIAVIAVGLTLLSGVPAPERRPARDRLDYPGLVLIAAGVAFSVFGFQQSATWGWGAPATGLCVGAGALLLVAFVLVESRTRSPLVRIDIFRIRAFGVDNVVLALATMVFVPLILFISQYARICLAGSVTQTWLILGYFFLGFSIAAQAGGRMLDRSGAKTTVVLGCTCAAAGFGLWAGQVTGLDFGSQRWCVVLTGAGMGLVMGPVNADAVNHASQLAYGEVIGITQTVRNYSGALGLAILGTIMLSITRSRLIGSLVHDGVPRPQAVRRALEIARAGGDHWDGEPSSIQPLIRLDFAYAMSGVLYVMAGLMALAAVVGMVFLRRGFPSDDPVAGPAQGQQLVLAP
jgi:EmrB/QacA subfamily drug resistance transporter